jgi:ribosomal protein L21E
MSVKHLQNEIKRIVKEYELEDQVEIVIEEIKQ